jgi:hypothetical protein
MSRFADGMSPDSDAVQGRHHGMPAVADHMSGAADALRDRDDHLPGEGNPLSAVADPLPENVNRLPGVGDALPHVADEVPDAADDLPGDCDRLFSPPGRGCVAIRRALAFDNQCDDEAGGVNAMSDGSNGMRNDCDALPDESHELSGDSDGLRHRPDGLPGGCNVLPDYRHDLFEREYGDAMPRAWRESLLPDRCHVAAGVGDNVPGISDAVSGERDGLSGARDELPGVADGLRQGVDIVPGAGDRMPVRHDVMPREQHAMSGNCDRLLQHHADRLPAVRHDLSDGRRHHVRFRCGGQEEIVARDFSNRLAASFRHGDDAAFLSCKWIVPPLC